MKRLVVRLLKNRRGTAAVEYAMICGMIVIGLVAAVAGVGDQSTIMWADITSKTADAMEKAR